MNGFAGKRTRLSVILGLGFTGIWIAQNGHAGPAPLPQQTAVFVSGQYGYHSYRIPALIVTQKGTVLAFCEGRKTSRNDHGDLDLVLKRSADNGKTWSSQQIVYEEGGTAKITIGNPCPVIDEQTGTIWLPFCRDNRDVLLTKSTDDGLTWSPPIDITKAVKKPQWGWYATGPGVGIQLRRGPHRGRLVVPCDHGATTDQDSTKSSHVIYSDDHGQTWRLGGLVGPHTNECQAVELADGAVLLNARNHWARAGNRPDRGGMRAIAASKDGGQSWSDVQFDSALIEPACQASFIRHTDADRHDKSRLLFSNPASKNQRIEMTVRMSYDEGKTWPVARRLHAGPSAYSCLTVLPDMTIGCLYERGEKNAYETITFARFDLEWLTDGKESSMKTKKGE